MVSMMIHVKIMWRCVENDFASDTADFPSGFHSISE